MSPNYTFEFKLPKFNHFIYLLSFYKENKMFIPPKCLLEVKNNSALSINVCSYVYS